MDNIGGGAAKSGALVATDVLILLGFIAAVVGILVLTVYLVIHFRKNRKAERDRQIRGEHLAPYRRDRDGSAPDDDEVPESGRSGRRRVRRRRRDHRPRNPSRAESGGLPPIRPEDSAPSI